MGRPSQASRRTVRSQSAAGCTAGLDQAGIPAERRVLLEPNRRHDLGDLVVHTVPADHGDLSTTALTLVLEFGGVRVLASGDTSWRPYRNRSLTDEQKERNRQKSKVRARIEHVFGCMSQTMKGFYLRYIGRRRNGAAIGFINLIDNLARYEQIVRLQLIPLRAA